MNVELAKAIADVLRDSWTPLPEGARAELDSAAVYKDLISRGVEVPEGDMAEVLDQFKKAGIIGGPGYMNSEAHRQHGGMVITSVNRRLLDDLDLD